MNRPKKGTVPLNNPREHSPVPIISDAAMAGVGVGEGRLVPLLILDAAARPDLTDLFALHAAIPMGEVEVAWGKARFVPDGVSLMLSFRRPSKVIAFVEFDLTTQGGIVDMILAAQALYLQLGKPGDRLITTRDAHRILIEVPETGFAPVWEELLRKHLTKRFRADGFDRKEAVKRAELFITEWRSLNRIRMTGLPPQAEHD